MSPIRSNRCQRALRPGCSPPLLGLPLLLAIGLGAGCAEELAPRSTVQANVIAKSDLDGEWYFRQTVVGVPFTTGFTFIGEQGENEMEKIRWDIQEEVLTARRSYEFVRGSEKGAPSQSDPYLGAPVAAFKIESHFDIVRDYNASTGEEYDRVVENTERKWYERRFVRVDWSTNLITNFQFLADFDHGGISAIKQDPAPYFVSDPKDPDAIRVERPAPDKAASYLEFTQKIVASPESVDFEDEKNVPLCFLEYATEDCASQEIKLRNAFLRVEPRDYEPMVYTDVMMERFGFFTTERKSYNRQYGTTETGRQRFTNRHNVWRHSLAEQTCRAASECGPAQPGVRCATELPDAELDPSGAPIGRCTLPYAVRNLSDPSDPSSEDLGPRPIVYYLNDRFPADLLPAVQQSADEFDAVFRGISQTLTGRPPAGPSFVLCVHNPVEEGDPEACGPAGTHARIGDLRYNLIYWIDEPNSAHLLGYGPTSNDPETGEIVAAAAFIYGAQVDLWAAQARDVVALVNGDIQPDSFIAGVDVQNWVEQTRAGSHQKKAYAQAEVDAMADAMDLGWTKALPATPSIHKAPARALAQMARTRAKALAQSSMLQGDRGMVARRLQRLAGSELEGRLASSEIRLLRGRDPSGAGGVSELAPLSLVSPERARFVRRERRRLSARTVDLALSFDDAVLGLALQQQGKDPDEVRRLLRAEIFRSTALHETGHSLGLRHNFAGSFDAMNYPKEYWDLRNLGGAPKPRYLDPETATEQSGMLTSSGLQAGISEFEASSIMDYGSRFNSDIHGLGRYDRAALKFGYGQLVEVFDDVRDQYLMGGLQTTVTFGQPQPLLVNCAGDDYVSVHYTRLPQLVTLDARSDEPLASVERAELSSGCAYPEAVEHVGGRLVVPYRFCSDEFESASPDCAAYDRGADAYEVAANAIDVYRNYYLFTNFRRDRLGFSPENYLDRIYERSLDPLRQQMQFYTLFRADLAQEIPDDGTPTNFWRSPDGWGPFTVAVTEGFNLLGEILTTPEPGGYVRVTQADGRDAYQTDPYSLDPVVFQVPIPEGRYFATDWDDEGYFWYERVRQVGVFLDKVAALAELTDPETFFLGADAAADVRQYSINYYRLFPSQMIHVWAGALTDRWDRLAPVWNGSQVVKRPIALPITLPPAGSLPLDPQIGFSVQLWASALGLALVPATYDRSFLDSSRIFWQGNGQQIDSANPKVTFTDPFSGNIYVAVSYLNGVVETGIGARMIARANELESLRIPGDPETEEPVKSYVQLLEVVRSLTATYADVSE